LSTKKVCRTTRGSKPSKRIRCIIKLLKMFIWIRWNFRCEMEWNFMCEWKKWKF
jgi:hypothetical protein